jgi:hypothetical protein
MPSALKKYDLNGRSHILVHDLNGRIGALAHCFASTSQHNKSQTQIQDQNENESDEMRLESDEKINPSSVVLCLRL